MSDEISLEQFEELEDILHLTKGKPSDKLLLRLSKGAFSTKGACDFLEISYNAAYARLVGLKKRGLVQPKFRYRKAYWALTETGKEYVKLLGCEEDEHLKC